jgi:hypothetical protein
MRPDGTGKTGHTLPCLAERQSIFSGGLVYCATEEDGMHRPTARVPSGVCEARFLGLPHLGEYCASGDEGSLVEGEGVDDSCVGC